MKRLLMAILICGSATAASAQTPDPAIANYVQVKRISALARRCNWPTPLATSLLRAAVNEAEAGLGPQALTAANAQASQAVNADFQLACNAPQAAQAHEQVDEATNQLMGVAMLRSAALVAASAGNAWSSNLTALEPQSALFNTVLDNIKASNPAGFSKDFDAALGEARLALTLICEERKTVRSASPRACPTVAPKDKARTAWAHALVTGLEGVSLALAAEAAKQR